MKSNIIIIGAGAAGLMAARELGKAGKKVIILEARDRIGGRIFPLDEKEFGYPAQGGAEFAHGEAHITKALAKEAGMTLILTQGDMWNSRDGEVTVNSEPIPNQDELHKKLRELKSDLPIAEFLEKYFSEEKYARLRNSIIRMVEGYDAGDVNRISTFTLREEWLGGGEWLQYRIKEGYGAMLKFLERECRKNGVEIQLNAIVKEVEAKDDIIVVRTADGDIFEAEKVVVTVPVPVISGINFIPAIPEKMEAASKIGFGNVIKLLIRFKNRWWVNALGKDFSEMDFIFSGEEVRTWWTQYPDLVPVLTGWIPGPRAEKYKNSSDKDILELALDSLSNVFKVDREFVRKEIVASKIVNWPADPYAKGAYSYSTTESEEGYEELRKPAGNKIFFAGEALYAGKDTATVEGALASGLETARKILKHD
ncbi:hypothetical protein A3I27_01910 [Candidatus Giovannonibacteria bacterium RIFCSPLOWO2_02_FULL_43_11b]|uniref:Amine oxidase domain-containing protein n=1 Tax=Candidatus Giovannonibacteria bacterium RIFCSPHIGHO2_12_FULL_43_15 TaxID=1798341 RepID=A0A1F5WQU7_9BACT|nr:MAG: hypothetical protein A2739_01910 [Candidatus Giovannonibacteria bacterium RIFCSPHIGHO2_01_FULL_43_100]OGF67830.1 MAG: hypothetical protein A3B97_00940 [Candidatus Giovannonibacteria bacterium RIFCSPHIGHO2_02_FULL_43_32]OGF77990.1 MAG: hypothetical protein A3F23_03295 [Candidatus Giovannonibacteria bacterium RIFCSPHIGHO2_12_FULL_43_15]OGF79511.1 MAG: hypothetical protein A3A15_02160 [Candidatus Giovannonibacteria bacterium RIFCSPLOWO2_01_FULL_43_60]OGF89240.1 MAG: hypothetical protein A3